MKHGKSPFEPNRDEDKKIWHTYAKGVKRIAEIVESAPYRHPGESRDPDIVTKKKNKKLIPAPSLPKDKTAIKPDSLWIPAFAGMTQKQNFALSTLHDRKTERALRSGEIMLDAKLDLHGMTQDKAFSALQKFMALAVKRGHRNLLIITGKGRMGKSVLRASLPLWIESLHLKSYLRDIRTAAMRHGGDGAFYVLLKKPKL